MHALPYRSPFRLLGLSPGESTHERLQQLRKSILAEFELQGGSTISWNGTTIDKQQALDLIEELRAPERLRFHQQVAENRSLLNLLEEKSFDFVIAPSGEYDRDFIHACAPYFTHSLGTLAVKAFEESNVVWFIAIAMPHPLKTPEVLARCWDKLRTRLNRALDELQELKKNLAKSKRDPQAEAQLKWWTEHIKPNVLAGLPEALRPEREKLNAAWVELLWFITDRHLKTSAKLQLLDELQQVSDSPKSSHPIVELRRRLAQSGITAPRLSRRMGLLFALPLLLLLSWIVLNKATNDLAFIETGLRRTIGMWMRYAFGIYLLVMLVVALEHAYNKLQRARTLWTIALFALNLIALPVYWTLFIRNPKDRKSNVIGIVLLVLTLTLSVVANFLGEQ